MAPISRLALSREEAATSLGMSLDSSERHVQPTLRLCRLGRMRLVPVSELQRWLEDYAERTLDAASGGIRSHAGQPYRPTLRARAMSVTTTCDYCRATLDRFWAKISVEGVQPDDGALDWRRISQYYGHYCTEPREGEAKCCLQKVENAIFLAESFGPTLESIPTISNQQLAYRRRRMRQEGEDRSPPPEAGFVVLGAVSAQERSIGQARGCIPLGDRDLSPRRA